MSERPSTLTTGEQRMCWHAARGQDTPLPPQEVTEILDKISRLTAERDGWRRRAEDTCPRHERLLAQFTGDKRAAELAAYDQLNRADTLRVERDALRAAGDSLADLIASWRTLVGAIVESGDPGSHVGRLEVRDFGELFRRLDRWRALGGGATA